MQLKIHHKNGVAIAELVSDNTEINEVQDALNLMGNAGFHDARKIIVRKEHLHPDFFELRTGMAGEILQKFSTYQVQLAIVGNFSEIKSKSLKDFIYESNKMGRINFLPGREEALSKLSQK